MVDDKKQRKITKKTQLISIYTQTQNLSKNSFDDEQAEHLAVQNGTVLGIIGQYECCWF